MFFSLRGFSGKSNQNQMSSVRWKKQSQATKFFLLLLYVHFNLLELYLALKEEFNLEVGTLHVCELCVLE